MKNHCIETENMISTEGKIVSDISDLMASSKTNRDKLAQFIVDMMILAAVPIEELTGISPECDKLVLSGEYYSVGDEKAPFFSEAYLYNLMGKGAARNITLPIANMWYNLAKEGIFVADLVGNKNTSKEDS